MPGDQARRMMAQPAWKTQLQRTQPGFKPLPPVLEEDGDTTSAAASVRSPATSTQRNADAARDAQDSSSLLDDADTDDI